MRRNPAHYDVIVMYIDYVADGSAIGYCRITSGLSAPGIKHPPPPPKKKKKPKKTNKKETTPPQKKKKKKKTQKKTQLLLYR